MNITLQRPLTEQQPRYSDKQACCSGKHQQLGLPYQSQLVATRTTLTTANALCLSQTEHGVQNSTYCSQFEPPRCSENPTRCSECFLSQIAKHVFQSMQHFSQSVLTRCSGIHSHCSEFTQSPQFTNLNLLTATRSDFAAASTYGFKHFYHKTTTLFFFQ